MQLPVSQSHLDFYQTMTYHHHVPDSVNGICAHVHAQAQAHEQPHVHTYTHVHTRTHTYTYTYTYAYTHTHTWQTQALKLHHSSQSSGVMWIAKIWLCKSLYHIPASSPDR